MNMRSKMVLTTLHYGTMASALAQISHRSEDQRDVTVTITVLAMMQPPMNVLDKILLTIFMKLVGLIIYAKVLFECSVLPHLAWFPMTPSGAGLFMTLNGRLGEFST